MHYAPVLLTPTLRTDTIISFHTPDRQSFPIRILVMSLTMKFLRAPKNGTGQASSVLVCWKNHSVSNIKWLNIFIIRYMKNLMQVWDKREGDCNGSEVYFMEE